MAIEPEQTTNDTEHQDDGGVAELQFLRDLYATHGRYIIAAGIVLLAVVVAVSLHGANAVRNRREASAALLKVRSAEDLKALVSNYPSTPSAAIAVLRLAKGHYDSGDYDMALGIYDEFVRDYPKHEMLAIAELGRVHCMEARLQLDEALRGFTAFAESHPGHFLVSQAVLGRARCLEQMGKHAEAKAVYEDFVAANPESGWLPTVEERLAAVAKVLGESGTAKD